jgi:hypothetical protein
MYFMIIESGAGPAVDMVGFTLEEAGPRPRRHRTLNTAPGDESELAQY